MPSDPESLHGDLRRRAAMDTAEMDWTPSPSGTVWRKRVHRVGPLESGQVTSVVRYLPGAAFPAHDHPEGEEILVLEGVFSDEHGDWPAGTHLLNPEGFRHAPYSTDGCLLFVKLRQYAGVGRPYQKTTVRELAWRPSGRDGVDVKGLYEDPTFPDSMRLERWAEGAAPGALLCEGGLELFVLEGALEDLERRYGPGAWCRLPDGDSWDAHSREGCIAYVKAGGVTSLRGDL